jgi:Protein of unknown function (DUF2530)
MRPEDEQPTVHEIGNRTFIVAPVEPLDLDGVRTMQVGTALWAIGFVVLFLLRHRLAAHDHEWWVGVAAVGFALGLVGWEHTTRRRRHRRQAEK